MKHLKFGLKLGLCALAIGFSGLTKAADCEIPDTTNATSVQSDSGNGTYNCSVHWVRLPTGEQTQLQNVTSLTNLVEIPPNTGTTASWLLHPDADGKLLDIRIVSVASNSGKRCNYTYSDLPTGGSGLTTTNGSSDTTSKTVTLCAASLDPVTPPPSEPPQPISTVGDQCIVDFDYNGTEDNKFDIAIGYSKQQSEDSLNEGVAICANTGSAYTKQKQCINECVPNLDALPSDSDSCKVKEDGTYSLDCAQCEWDAPPSIDALFKDADGNFPNMKYCWYYENRVNEVDGTFKPSPKKKSLSANIDVSTGSNCYTVTVGPMYGGRTYSYWYCPQ